MERGTMATGPATLLPDPCLTKIGLQKEGIYASSTSLDVETQKTDHGLTLHPKIQSGDVWGIESDWRISEDDFNDAWIDITDVHASEGGNDPQSHTGSTGICNEDQNCDLRHSKRRKLTGEHLDSFLLRSDVSSEIESISRTPSLGWSSVASELGGTPVPNKARTKNMANVECRTFSQDSSSQKQRELFGIVELQYVQESECFNQAEYGTASAPGWTGNSSPSSQKDLIVVNEEPFTRKVKVATSTTGFIQNGDQKNGMLEGNVRNIPEVIKNWNPDVPIPSVETVVEEGTKHKRSSNMSKSVHGVGMNKSKAAAYGVKNQLFKYSSHDEGSPATTTQRGQRGRQPSSTSSVSDDSQAQQALLPLLFSTIAVTLADHPKQASLLSLINDIENNSTTQEVPAKLRKTFDALLAKFRTDEPFASSTILYFLQAIRDSEELVVHNKSSASSSKSIPQAFTQLQLDFKLLSVRYATARKKQEKYRHERDYFKRVARTVPGSVSTMESYNRTRPSLEEWVCGNTQCGNVNPVWAPFKQIGQKENWRNLLLCQACGTGKPPAKRQASIGTFSVRDMSEVEDGPLPGRAVNTISTSHARLGQPGGFGIYGNDMTSKKDNTLSGAAVTSSQSVSSRPKTLQRGKPGRQASQTSARLPRKKSLSPPKSGSVDAVEDKLEDVAGFDTRARNLLTPTNIHQTNENPSHVVSVGELGSPFQLNEAVANDGAFSHQLSDGQMMGAYNQPRMFYEMNELQNMNFENVNPNPYFYPTAGHQFENNANPFIQLNQLSVNHEDMPVNSNLQTFHESTSLSAAMPTNAPLQLSDSTGIPGLLNVGFSPLGLGTNDVEQGDQVLPSDFVLAPAPRRKSYRPASQYQYNMMVKDFDLLSPPIPPRSDLRLRHASDTVSRPAPLLSFPTSVASNSQQQQSLGMPQQLSTVSSPFSANLLVDHPSLALPATPSKIGAAAQQLKGKTSTAKKGFQASASQPKISPTTKSSPTKSGFVHAKSSRVQKSHRREKYSPEKADLAVKSANATLHLQIGGRRKSWDVRPDYPRPLTSQSSRAKTSTELDTESDDKDTGDDGSLFGEDVAMEMEAAVEKQMEFDEESADPRGSLERELEMEMEAAALATMSDVL